MPAAPTIRPALFAALLLSACARRTAAPAPEVTAHGTLAVTVGDDGFSPSAIAVAKGEPLTLTFTRTSTHTCAERVVFPELHIDEALPVGKAVSIPVPTDAARTLSFTCGMGMYASRVVVR